jgi:hypothetical protein
MMILNGRCVMGEYKDNMTKTCEEVAKLLHWKQDCYGPGNISAFGYQGVLVRMNDKFERLKNLYKKKENPPEETIEDTLLDIAGYAIIGLMVRRGQWK